MFIYGRSLHFVTIRFPPSLGQSLNVLVPWSRDKLPLFVEEGGKKREAVMLKEITGTNLLHEGTAVNCTIKCSYKWIKMLCITV